MVVFSLVFTWFFSQLIYYRIASLIFRFLWELSPLAVSAQISFGMLSLCVVSTQVISLGLCFLWVPFRHSLFVFFSLYLGPLVSVAVVTLGLIVLSVRSLRFSCSALDLGCYLWLVGKLISWHFIILKIFRPSWPQCADSVFYFSCDDFLGYF